MTGDQKLLCIGYGHTAAALGRRLSASGWSISGTTRSGEKAAAMRRDGIEALIWRGAAFDPAWRAGVSAVLISTPPDENGCPGLRALREQLPKTANIQWIGYLSTNGVYGDHQGAWVDETSPLRASSGRALRRIQAEKEWAAFAAKHDLPLTTFRLPGIYGPGRSAFDKIRAGTATRIHKPEQVFSRMHVDDIATALMASLEQQHSHDLYNLADDEPAPPQDVIEYACKLLNIAPPPLIAIEDANLSPMAMSFYADNKRISNQRMKDALGVRLKFPTYREGLSAIFDAERHE